jgi:hypothetical protein
MTIGYETYRLHYNYVVVTFATDSSNLANSTEYHHL